MEGCQAQAMRERKWRIRWCQSDSCNRPFQLSKTAASQSARDFRRQFGGQTISWRQAGKYHSVKQHRRGKPLLNAIVASPPGGIEPPAFSLLWIIVEFCNRR